MLPAPVADAVLVGIEQALGRKSRRHEAPFHQADMQATWADIAKAPRLLGWAPTVELAEGIRRTVAWYAAHRDWLKDVKL